MSSWWDSEARRLHSAETTRQPVSLLSYRQPEISLDEAYRIQWHGTALRVADGARVVGHKVGLTSASMQEQFGIDQPDSGLLLDYMAVQEDGELRLGDLVAPRVEGELAFRLGTDLIGADVSEKAIRHAVASTFLALEVIDSRYGFEGLTLADSVADNAACGRFVLGAAVAGLVPELGAEHLTLTVDGAAAASGFGRAILGDPLRSVAWLVHRLAAFGTGLRAGDVVLAGAVHASLPLSAGQTVAVGSPRLPQAVLHVA
ncbi:2-hydroxypenta-2,4-dienoate hydratase [Streptomyces fradiae]|uniref:2-hydroxypenta-2,4-dienoate hydratase n=2 Tax=Streptomyces TaxID=1883 RepID=A0A3R7LL31_9ACTN|nr:2-hydroxypenta-2,4-dienoate hydratase [Streptomyces fradiae]OFA44209.1 2-hydroxypenta-2,4-dienoate hydratase [Streptomyces fradiae]PQM20600.1 2-hydroxypenta-2,4-dienoate hydratase [Streptomyces xinghaiensis]RKM92542.1 2-hydroxypenta-2,4-dienoate hydratase [Streptomyces xinghaiensis]RNC70509.1 2-hydroxypenta-2,4-dienoate hydratase [Streptomyces xinghaiensis]